MFDFPNSPTVGQQVSGSGGSVYKWDGTKWAATSGSVVTTGITPPASPQPGALWWDSVGGQLYIYYNDGNSSQWVAASAMSTGQSTPPIVAPPAAASWTQQNFNAGVTTFTDVANGVQLFDVGPSGTQMRGVYRAAPTPPYMIDANFSALALLTNISAAYKVFDMGWTDGTKIQNLGIYFLTGSANNTLAMRTFTTASASAAPVGGTYYDQFNLSNIWMRIRDDGTNIYTYVSHDGVNYLQVYTIAKASGFLGASGYTNVGFFFESAYMGVGISGLVTLKSWWVH